MTDPVSNHVFLLGSDYHLGDLLWFTAVLAEYRRERSPSRVVVTVPDRPISRILERNPMIDELRYGEPRPRWTRSDVFHAVPGAEALGGDHAVLHDLRIIPIACAMLRQWRRRLPWLYYRDLWLAERGQWLATFLGLGRLHDYRPILRLGDDDRTVARDLPSPYVVLAPHIGTYSVPLAGSLWRRVKGWQPDRWAGLAHHLRRSGYHPVTLAAAGQTPIPNTVSVIGLPIRQVAGVIERAAVLVTVESGLWFVAAALETPFIITPWWLPRSVDWAAPMNVPYRLMYRGADSVRNVAAVIQQLESE